MNILFLTMSSSMKDVNSPGIYTDLIRQLIQKGNTVYLVVPAEKRTAEQTHVVRGEGWTMLRVKTGNLQKSGMIEKGIAQIRIQGQYLKAIRQFWGEIRFDLILYSTPPITFSGLVRNLKQKHHAGTYLLLKDIFPQNAVDLGMMGKSGIKGLLYRYFRAKEKKLYALSDRIGCMSPANVAYVLQHNPQIDPARVEICPNSLELQDLRLDQENRMAMRRKYGLPLDKKIFVYGGNLGKPQGVEHLIRCIRNQSNREDRFFFMVGSGTEYPKLKAFAAEKQQNFRLMSHLPKEDYDRLVAACDVGMIFLDHRFTIPNFPSRLLSYLQAGLPVLCCTDPNTDVGAVCEQGGFGWQCESDDPQKFSALADQICAVEELAPYGQKGFCYLQTHYTATQSADIILKNFPE